MIKYSELIKNINILLVDDDEDYLIMTNAFLRQLGYNVDTAINGGDALEMLNRKDYQILLLDYFMPEINGEEVIREVRKKDKEIIIILQTGFSGQKPPVETMQTLNIQNYYDKTEGIDKLNLELISAVKIFDQQNEIQLDKYRQNAIANLMSSVAQEIKANLLSVSAGIEVTNMLIQDRSILVENDNLEKLNSSYIRSKESLGRVDKVLTAIINQSNNATNQVMRDNDIVDIIKLMLKTTSYDKGVELNTKISLRVGSYISGAVNDVLFIVCEILRELMEISSDKSSILFVLTEDQDSWYFNISNSNITKINTSKIYLIKRLIISLENVEFELEDNKIKFMLKKV